MMMIDKLMDEFDDGVEEDKGASKRQDADDGELRDEGDASFMVGKDEQQDRQAGHDEVFHGEGEEVERQDAKVAKGSRRKGCYILLSGWSLLERCGFAHGGFVVLDRMAAGGAIDFHDAFAYWPVIQEEAGFIPVFELNDGFAGSARHGK